MAEELLAGHRAFTQVMTHRLTSARLIRSLWQRDRKAAIQHVQQLNDVSISVDFTRQIMRRERELTLELCVALLPVIRHIFSAPLDNYLLVALEATSLTWHAFGDVINKTLATKSHVVDLSLEERKDRCRIARHLLSEIRLEVLTLRDRRDDVGQRSRLLWKELPDDDP